MADNNANNHTRGVNDGRAGVVDPNLNQQPESVRQEYQNGLRQGQAERLGKSGS